MHPPRFPLGLGAYCATAALASACLWSSSPRIKLQQQLPEGIFVNLAADPLTMELALPGRPTQVLLGTSAGDPRQEIAAVIKHYESERGGRHTFTEQNDYAVALIYSGRYLEALAVLHAIEVEKPGQYATASNLGTAYELNGNLDEALKWISEGIKRNPKSHAGTEWLHVAILEAKKQLKQDPRWLHKHSVLDGHEGRSQAEKERALEYQLNERLNFITENDPVMHDLFSQAAKITANQAKRDYYLSQLPRFREKFTPAIATPIPVRAKP